MIFDENDNFYILIEFESNRLSPRESTKKMDEWAPTG